MKVFFIFATMFGLLATLNAQTTIRIWVEAPGDEYDGGWDVTYDTGSFDSFQADIDDATWWANEALAQSFADGADVNNLRFVFSEFTVVTPDYALYSDNTTSVGNYGAVDTSASGLYAISAEQVPAPLPILGILPVVGFLKRMRKRQRSR